MSRPGTRSKNKKRKDNDDGSITAEILRYFYLIKCLFLEICYSGASADCDIF